MIRIVKIIPMKAPPTAKLIVVLLTTTLLGCDGREPTSETLTPSILLETGTVRIETATDTFVLQVEIAEAQQQREQGLMHRPSLESESGMIFLFQREQRPDHYFYMYNTLIPLSIAFIDEDGRIGNIREMEPCPSQHSADCPNYEARVPFWTALEVNSGYFTERAIGIGDRVVLERN